jgi:predicted aspartyl protease
VFLDDMTNTITDDLKKLLDGDKDVEEVNEQEISHYKKVIRAVKEAGNGEIKTFKVQIDGTRAEFYVVSVNEKEGKVVGLKALSVES